MRLRFLCASFPKTTASRHNPLPTQSDAFDTCVRVDTVKLTILGHITCMNTHTLTQSPKTPNPHNTWAPTGWFAIYDGHAGKKSADYCGETLHNNFTKLIREQPTKNTPEHIQEILYRTFSLTDYQLSQIQEHYSGCTAIVAYLGVYPNESGVKEVCTCARCAWV